MSSPSRRHIWSALLGNLFEHYDTALFGLLSPFLAPLFFSDYDPASALILTYGIIPLGMIARPIGSLAFGWLAAHKGRRTALFLSLLGMAGVSGLIALTPTYAQAGLLAPALLCLGRFLQNFFATGEIVGGAMFVLEHTPEKNHDFMSSLYAVTTVSGILLASAAVSLLSFFNVIELGWRVLYLFGGITALFGTLLRRYLPICNEETKLHPKTSLTTILKTLWEERRTLLVIAMASGFGYATYSMALVLMNGFVPLISDITKTEIMGLNTILLFLDLLALPVFGLLATKFSRTKMMASAAACGALSGIPLFFLLEGATLLTVFFVRICLVIIGVWFSATFSSWSQKLLPESLRYPIISFGYAVGSQVLGSPTAAISLWLYKTTGVVVCASLYWVVLGAVTCLCILRKSAYSSSLYTNASTAVP